MCDVKSLVATLFQYDSYDKLLFNLKPWTDKKILDLAELVLRYDWACLDAKTKHKQPPADINAEVVSEWHYAMNWLIGLNDAEWDTVEVIA